MRNIDKIKQMNVDEMAEFLSKNAAKILVKAKSSDFANEDLVKQWLMQESEDFIKNR